MPVIGAARTKLTDVEWQDQVKRWIDGSVIILMIAGVTGWVDWELKEVIAHDAVSRLIICFPPDKSLRNFSSKMKARLDRLRGAFAGTRWSAALEQLDDAKSLRSLVLGEDGRVSVVRSRARDRDSYHLAVLIAHWVNGVGLRDVVTDVGSKSLPSRALYRTKRWRVSVALLGAIALIASFTAALVFSGVIGSGTPRPGYLGQLDQARAGNKQAMATLGDLYLYGKGVKADPAEAFTWYSRAADGGHLGAKYMLARMYREGMGIPKDLARAALLFREAAAGGVPDADTFLGEAYLFGLGVSNDYSQAATLFRTAMDKGGGPSAAYYLGLMNDKGWGIPHNAAEAVRLYTIAANVGMAEATLNLGALLYNGDGVPRDLNRARQLFEEAAKSQDPTIRSTAEKDLELLLGDGALSSGTGK
jgi:TPR repeat protein